MIVDAATLTFLGYAGTVRIQKQNFRMMLNSENIPYTAVSAVDVRKWPEIKQEINEAIPAVVKKLQWVVLLGAISFNDVTSKQPNYATRPTR